MKSESFENPPGHAPKGPDQYFFCPERRLVIPRGVAILALVHKLALESAKERESQYLRGQHMRITMGTLSEFMGMPHSSVSILTPS
jgi:hypothetical protein